MSKYDLSILIPARNEMFIAETVKDLLANKTEKTEIIVGLDGQFADPPIASHPDLTIVYYPKSLGQRAMTNQLCKLSKAKYVAKTDAHCSFDKHFDAKLMSVMKDHYTILPAMYNFHVFDWVCIGNTPRSGKKYIDTKIEKLPIGCGHREYQGPTIKCSKCGGNMERELIWKRRENKRNEFYRFDKNYHFQYWNSFKNRPEGSSNLAPVMSIPGNFFMLTRQKYWALNICDEGHGSWGQQGVEVACKTWLSGGELVVYKDTWYAHMFRTQGKDFGFPYPISTVDQEKARQYSKDIWSRSLEDLKKVFPLAIHDTKWLIEKFRPIPDWHDQSEKNIENALETENPQLSIKKEPQKSMIFYTDNQLNIKLAHMVQNKINYVQESKGISLISASLKPMPHFGHNIYIKRKRGLETYFTQILSALEAVKTDIVYFLEHDVLYHSSHFDFVPERKDVFYYNQNFWKVRKDGFAVHWDANQVSGLVCYKELAIEFYKKKLEDVKNNIFDRSYEPGGRDESKYIAFNSECPNIDIRHHGTMTKDKWSPADFRDKSTCKNWISGTINSIPGWDHTEISKALSYL